MRFGPFEFDPASGDLRKGGRRIRLQNQPRQVLKLLLSRPGELVTREELRRLLWPDDTFVDFDNGLNVAVRKIRDALGDVTPSPRFIETERAQGYRFIAPITEPGPVLVEQAGTRRPTPAWRVVAPAILALAALTSVTVWMWRTAGTGVPARTAQDPPRSISLAVLPFGGRSADGDDFLSLGIPDGIVTRLSNVRQFRVRPMSAVAQYQGRRIDPQEAGRRLESTYVLAGTIRMSGDRVRVTAQLVRTADGSRVWGDRFDRPRADLAGVEDAVAEQIARALRVRMSDAERDRLDRRYTRSGAAYERYLMGRARLRALTEHGALQAIAEFEAARDLDPSYAPAYAGLAAAAAQIRLRFASPIRAAVWGARAREEARRALALDGDLAQAHEALAAVYRFQEHDWDTVIRESGRALELNPSLDTAHLHLAAAYFHLGLLDSAVREVQAARELNPENRAEPLEILGAVSLFAGRTQEAARHLSQARDFSDSRIVRYLFGWTLYYLGDRQGAETRLESMIDDQGPVPGNARATLAAIRAARGATRDARALARRVESEPDLLHHAAYALGTMYAQLGEPAAALRWLSQAATTGFPCYPWYERDPLLDPIREEPRFTDFMRELRSSWENARAKYSTVGG